MSEHELIRPGRIPMTDEESAALQKLLDQHPGVTGMCLTRALPGETGPILATVGEVTYEIDGSTVTATQ